MNPVDTHFCLVSAQPVPNLIPALDPGLAPRRVVLLVSAGMERKAQWLEEVLRARGKQVVRWAIDNAWDVAHIEQRVLEWLEGEMPLVAVQGVALNVTGGTKLMGIAAYEVFRAYDLPVFYVHPERDEVIWLRPAAQPLQPLQDRIRLEPFLQAHGTSVVGEPSRAVPKRHYLELAAELVKEIERYRKAIGVLNALAAGASSGLRSPPIRKRWSTLDDLISLFSEHGLLSREGQHLCFPDEEARFFVNGGWLEYHVFDAVRTLRKNDPRIQDIAFGMEVERQQRDRKIPNEFDVVFLRDNRLHLVECKTRKFRHRGADAPGAEALYKLDALGDLMGGLQARVMLVSYLDLPSYHRTRAADLRVGVCAGTELRHLHEHLARFVA